MNIIDSHISQFNDSLKNKIGDIALFSQDAISDNFAVTGTIDNILGFPSRAKKLINERDYSENFYISSGLVCSGSDEFDKLSREEQILEIATRYNFCDSLENESTLLGACGYSTWSLIRFLKHYKEYFGSDFDLFSHQIGNLPGGDHSHTFAVVVFPSGKSYILDNTFSQFLSANVIDGSGNCLGSYVRNHPQTHQFVDELVTRGYAPLTPNNVSLYQSVIANQVVDDADISAYFSDSFPDLIEEYNEEEYWAHGKGLLCDIPLFQGRGRWFLDNEGERVYIPDEISLDSSNDQDVE